MKKLFVIIFEILLLYATSEEIPFMAKYIDKVTNKEVSLSSILTKNSNNTDTILLCHGMFGNKNSDLNKSQCLFDKYSIIF